MVLCLFEPLDNLITLPKSLRYNYGDAQETTTCIILMSELYIISQTTFLLLGTANLAIWGTGILILMWLEQELNRENYCFIQKVLLSQI